MEAQTSDSRLRTHDYCMIVRRHRTRKTQRLAPGFGIYNLKPTHRYRFLNFCNLKPTIHILQIGIKPAPTSSILRLQISNFTLKPCLSLLLAQHEQLQL